MTIETEFELGQQAFLADGTPGKVIAFSVSESTGREILLEDDTHRSYWWPEGGVFSAAPKPVKTDEQGETP